jgi:hypothetical protein
MLVEKIYSYIVVEDNGYSPHPFFGALTLSWCKPLLRRSCAKILTQFTPQSVWLVGLSPLIKDQGNGIIFMCQVNHALSYDNYYHQYPKKRANLTAKERVYQVGDNCYEADSQSLLGYRQHPSLHVGEEIKKRDLSGQAVLVGKHFVYFGNNPLTLPENLQELRVKQGYKSNFSPDTLQAFDNLTNDYKNSILSGTVFNRPRLWSMGDTSWQSQYLN